MVIKDKRIYLLGPTATGKTELVKHLNDLFPIDIISVDSAQIYKNLGRKEDALFWIDEALSNRPDFKEALEEKKRIKTL